MYIYTDTHIYIHRKICTEVRYTEELIIVFFLGGRITDDLFSICFSVVLESSVM